MTRLEQPADPIITALEETLALIQAHILPLYGPDDLPQRVQLSRKPQDGTARVFPLADGYRIWVYDALAQDLFDLTDAAQAGSDALAERHRQETAALFGGDMDDGRAMAFIAGLAFAAFHELAHVTLGHVDRRAKALGLGDAAMDESEAACADAPRQRGQTGRTLTLDRIMELEADGIALQLTLANLPELAGVLLPPGAWLPPADDLGLRRAGILGALAVLALLERRWHSASDYPHPATRLLNLAGGLGIEGARYAGYEPLDATGKPDTQTAQSLINHHVAVTLPALFMLDAGQADTGLGARLLNEGATTVEGVKTALMDDILAILAFSLPEQSDTAVMLVDLDAQRAAAESVLEPWRWTEWRG